MKRCAYIPCGAYVEDTAQHPRRYCSPACKVKQCVRRKRARLQSERVAEFDDCGQRRRQLVCQLVGCGKPIPSHRHPNTAYCSGACKEQSRRLQALAAVDRRREKLGQPARVPRKAPTPPVPVVTVASEPTVELPPAAKPCLGCKHLQLQPASWRGVECAAGRFTACNPLAPTGPRLKEAV